MVTLAGTVVAAGVRAGILTPFYETFAEMDAATIDANADYVQAGPYLYRKVSSGEHFTTSGGAKLKVIPFEGARYQAEAFGIVGDGVTDNTTKMQAALVAIDTDGGGTLKFGAGTFVGQMQLLGDTQQVRDVSIEGEQYSTHLMAPADETFALLVGTNGFYVPGHAQPVIRNIIFSGGASGRRCGVYMCRRLSFENVAFHLCMIGVLCSANFYGHWARCNFNECDVGIWFESRGTSELTITGLLDASLTERSVVLPFAGAGADFHSVNKSLEDIRLNDCRIGMYMYGTGGEGQYSLSAHKITCEVNRCAIIIDRGELYLIQPWMEANEKSGTVTIDGRTYAKNDFVLANSGDRTATIGAAVASTYRGSTLHLHTGVVGGFNVGNGCHLTANGISLSASPTIVVAEEGSVDLDHIVFGADEDLYIKRPQPLSGPLGCYSPFKTQRTYGHHPAGGKVLISDDCTGTAFASGISWSSGFEGTATFEIADGVFAEQKCVQLAVEQGDRLRFTLTGEAVAGQYYVVAMNIKSPETCNLLFLGNTLNNTATLPANTWVSVLNMHYMILDLWDDNAALTALQMQFGGTQTLPAGTHNILLSGVQVLRFSSLAAAHEFTRSHQFYML